MFFKEQTKGSLKDAILKFNDMTWNKQEIRKHALTFDEEIFKEKIRKYVEEKYIEHKNKMSNIGRVR